MSASLNERLRIHIVGASGSGTSTLGRALAEPASLVFFDADDFFWEPTDPPYLRARGRADRERMLAETLTDLPRWVLAGSIVGWDAPVAPLFGLIVFVLTPTVVRLARLDQRERRRFGDRLLPGGDMHRQHHELLTWAAGYDDGGADMRSRRMHEDWLSGLGCPVLRVDGTRATPLLVSEIAAALIHGAGRHS